MANPFPPDPEMVESLREFIATQPSIITEEVGICQVPWNAGKSGKEVTEVQIPFGGGPNPSTRPEVRKKISETMKLYHQLNPMSDEDKKKRDSSKNRIYTKGRKQTPEEKAKQIAAQTGKKRGPYKKRKPTN